MLIYIVYCALSFFVSAAAMQTKSDFLRMVQGDQYPNTYQGNQFCLTLDYYTADMLQALHVKTGMEGVVSHGFQQWLNARVQEIVNISDPLVQAHALEMLLRRLKPSANNNFSNTLQQYNSDENSETIYNLGVIITGINQQLVNLPRVNWGYYREFLDVANYYLGCSIHGSHVLNNEIREYVNNLISCNEGARRNLMNLHDAKACDENTTHELVSDVMISDENTDMQIPRDACGIVAPIPVLSSSFTDLLKFEEDDSSKEEEITSSKNSVDSLHYDQNDRQEQDSADVCNTVIQCKRGFFPYKRLDQSNIAQKKNNKNKSVPTNSQRPVKHGKAHQVIKPATPKNQDEAKKTLNVSKGPHVSGQSEMRKNEDAALAQHCKPVVTGGLPEVIFPRAVSLYEAGHYDQAEVSFQEYFLCDITDSLMHLHALCYRALIYMRKTQASYDQLIPYIRDIYTYLCSTNYTVAALKPLMNADFYEKMEQWLSVYEGLYASASTDERNKLDEGLYYLARLQLESDCSYIRRTKQERLTLMFKAARTHEYAKYCIITCPQVSLADRISYAAHVVTLDTLPPTLKSRVLEHNEKFAQQGHLSSLMAQMASCCFDEQEKIPALCPAVDRFFARLDKNFPEIKIGEHDGTLYVGKVLYEVLDQYAHTHWSARVLQAALLIAYISDDYSEVNAQEFTRLYEQALAVLEQEYKSHKVLKELLGTSYGIVGRFLQVKVVLNKDDIGLDELIPAYQKALQYFDKGVKLGSSRSSLYRARLYLCDRDIPGACDFAKGIRILKDMIRNNQMVLEAASALIVHFEAHNDKKNAQEYMDIAFRQTENNYNPVTWCMLENMQRKIDAIEVRKSNKQPVHDQEQQSAELSSGFENSLLIRKAMSDFALVIKTAKLDPEQALELLKCIDNKQLAMLDEINGEKVDKAYKRLVITIKVAANRCLSPEQFVDFARQCDEVLYDFNGAHERLLVEFTINMKTLKGCAEKKIAELQQMQREFHEIFLIPDFTIRQRRFDEFITCYNLEAVIGGNNVHCKNFLVRNLIEQYFDDNIKKLTERCKRADLVLKDGLYEKS